MKTLKEIIEYKKVVFTFGRFQGLSRGHELLIRKVFKFAKDNLAEPKIFISHTQDNNKNPLSYDQKKKYIVKGLLGNDKYIDSNGFVRDPFQALFSLDAMGYTDITMIVGDDRADEFRKKITPYIKGTGIRKFTVVNAGIRDADSDDITGSSASKIRELARQNNFKSFRSELPSSFSSELAKNLFSDLRNSMSLSEKVMHLSDTLGVKRKNMPQVATNDIPDFLYFLKKNGVARYSSKISVGDLRPTQKEVESDKIDLNFKRFSSGQKLIKPFIVSSDYYILDGHHQLFALKRMSDDYRVDCFVLSMRMKDLLIISHEYPKVHYKDI